MKEEIKKRKIAFKRAEERLKKEIAANLRVEFWWSDGPQIDIQVKSEDITLEILNKIYAIFSEETDHL